MPSFSTTILLVFTAIIGGASAYIFFFGLPPQLKREMQEAALETIGENKASYALQQGLNKVPDSQSKDLNEMKDGVGNALGGAMKNPLGKFAGNTADDATAPATGR